MAVLCCRKMLGSVTYDVLARTIEEILLDFQILEKCTAVVTDNGSNFVKAFEYVY